MTVKSTVRSAVRSAIRGTVRSGGALLSEWTPILDTLTTYFEYYANFTPTGSNSTLEIVFYKQGSKIQTIAFGDTSAFNIQLDASDVLTFNLISNVELNGVPATSGVTTVPDGYYVLTGDLDITSDIKYYAANATPANFFGIQIHSMKNIDNDDPTNSIDINTVKRSKDAPSASYNKLVNSLNALEVGSITNLTGYQPVLKGGGLSRENVADKSEQFNGDFSTSGYTLGVNTEQERLTSESSPVGSIGSWTDSISVGDIVVGHGGVVVKVTSTLGAPVTILDYTGGNLSGSADEQIQKGFEYPNIFRVIKPTDTSGEYAWYDSGKQGKWDGKQAPITRAELATMIANGDDVTNVNVSEIIDFSNLFNGVEVVGDISGWNVSSGTNFSQMFYSTLFNQDIGNWNVSSGTNFNAMFFNTPFNQDISSWDVSSGTNFNSMFYSTLFNQDIGNWNVSSGTIFYAMFRDSPFNQDISSWDVSSGTSFSYMFYSTLFNQDISSWDVVAATKWIDFKLDCPLLDEYTPPKFLTPSP